MLLIEVCVPKLFTGIFIEMIKLINIRFTFKHHPLSGSILVILLLHEMNQKYSKTMV